MMDLQEMSMTHEAVDYNALSWVRQEIDVTLRQAHAVLAEFSRNTGRVDLLHEYRQLLHQLRGPLQIAELAGADLLVAEMESVLAWLQADGKAPRDSVLEVLLQSMQILPAYLSQLHSSSDDSPGVVLPHVSLLRSIRGDQNGNAANTVTLRETALPEGVFLGRQTGGAAEIAARAHSARVRFQSGLLAWYRGDPERRGVAALADVLGQLQQDSGSESEARLWWVGAGVADALSAGLLNDSKEIKQLFGQLDRQIKRLVVSGNVDFCDQQTEELLDNLLKCIDGIEADDGRLATILATFGAGWRVVKQESVSVPDGKTEPGALLPSNDGVGSGFADHQGDGLDTGCSILVDVASKHHGDSIKAVSIIETGADFQEILKGISLCKETLDAFLKNSGADGLPSSVPDVLDGVCSNLRDTGLHREAEVIASVQSFVNREMLDTGHIPDEDQLCRLADAICSVEFYLECLRDGRISGSKIIDLAEQSVAALGFPVQVLHKVPQSFSEQNAPEDEEDSPYTKQDNNGKDVHDSTAVSRMQIVDPDADSEILEIFFDESDAELKTLRELVARIEKESVSDALLEEISRVFHTIKGNGRMLGAFVIGELAYLLEELANNAIKGIVPADDAFSGLLQQACDALSQLLEQVKDAASDPSIDIDSLASEILRMCRGASSVVSEHCQAEDAVIEASGTAVERNPGSVGMDYPVLTTEADPEIVEIFIDEAREEVARLAEIIPAWIAASGQDDILAEIRRSMHTLKGSGRMAGALFMGEFSWLMEDLLNRIIGGSVVPDDAIYSLVQKLPSFLQQLIDQITDGKEPGKNIREMMAEVVALRSRGCQVQPAAGTDSNDAEEPGITAGTGAASPEADGSLLQIYTRECQEILGTIRRYLDDDAGCGMVTEPLYRGLHTLAGISESAEVGPVARLASELDSYFSNLYYTQHRLPSPALDVLRESSDAIALLIEEMPGASGGTNSIDGLCDRIATLHTASAQTTDAEYKGQEETSTDPQGMPQNDASDPVGATVDSKSQHEDEFASVDQELFEVFLEEAAEIMDASEKVLHSWAAEPDNRDDPVEYQRYLHTLKGSARMMNVTAMGDLSHSLETLLTRVAENTVKPSANLFSALFIAQDQLTDMLEQVRQRRMPAPSADLKGTLEQLLQIPSFEPDQDAVSGINEDAGFTPDIDGPVTCAGIATVEIPEESAAPDLDEPGQDDIESCRAINSADELPVKDAATCMAQEPPVLQQQPALLPDIADTQQGIALKDEYTIPLRPPAENWHAVKQKKPVRKRGEPVKVQSEILDDLVNYAGEINIYRSRMETQIGDYRFNLGELEQTINRLRDQLRKLEMETEAQVLYRYAQESDRDNQDFDPLELDRYSVLQESSRSLMESISDLYSLLSLMENTTRESETLLLQQSRVSTDLHEGLMHTRMTPFSGLETRLKRIVRQSARQLDKKVELELQGAEGEMDRAVIDRIIAPLEHMLRNAVAHGIELPRDRISKGKEESGSITIVFGREGPDIVLRITDDGAGMDVNAIREKAVEKGLLDPDSDISESDVTQFVLQTGFSTAREVTQISGRGVGLDVVNSEVKQLGGSLHIESEQGVGTVFTIRLPYTLAINQALLVKAGSDTYCVPLGNVEGVVRVHPEELLAGYATEYPAYEYAGNQYQLKHLATLLNAGQLDANQMPARVPLLLMRVAERRIALHVESLLGSREIVIKPVGAQLSCIDGISGATILGDGGVAMILDVFALSRSNSRAHMPVIRMVSQDEKRLVVMVVDDSITVRKVTTRLLERNGYKVLTAKDGVDATGQLQGCTPDIMLLDIEMPRMDGFELATHMRNDERLRHVPVIMITSRTGDKHRERARQIGVNHYLGKPYQESDLLGTIDRIIRVTPDSAAIDHAGA